MSRTRTRSHMSAKKKLAALTSLALVAALLIGGAFAWTDFSQSFINRFRGGVTPDVLLHDDFEPWLNKDVYVENTGEQDLIVRVKFNEFLQIGNKVIVGEDANDKDEWDTHLFTEAPDYGSGDPDSEDYGLCYDCALETHTYFQWFMTGAKKTYLHGTSEQGNEDWDGQSIEDPNNLGPNDMMFGETQEASEIMTMEQWIASDKSAACWVLDADGWAYWSQALAPTKATNLLLDNVKLIQKPDDNFYYAIDVILNASNKSEYKKMYEGASTDAINNIIDPIANNVYTGRADFKLDDINWIVLAEDGDNMLILSDEIYRDDCTYEYFEFSSYSDIVIGVREDVNSWYSEHNSILKNYALMPTALSTYEDFSVSGWEADRNEPSYHSVGTTPAGDETNCVAFILSLSEVNEYLLTETDRKAVISGTENNGLWMLRSQGSNNYRFSYVDANGIVQNNGFCGYYSFGFRPALWVTKDILNNAGVTVY